MKVNKLNLSISVLWVLILLAVFSVSVVGALDAAPSGCAAPPAGETWDFYNHPDWYTGRSGTVVGPVEPCYFTVQFTEGDSIQFLAGDLLSTVPLPLGTPVSVEYRISTGQLAYYACNCPIVVPSPTPTPTPTVPSPSPSPSPTPTPTPTPSPTPAPKVPTSVVITETAIRVGTSVQLKAQVLDQNGAVMTGVNVTSWGSSDPSIASVNGGGLVQAKKVGTVRIWANYNTTTVRTYINLKITP